MLLPPVTGIAREETEDVGGVVFVTHSYSSKQCSVVDKLLDYLKVTLVVPPSLSSLSLSFYFYFYYPLLSIMLSYFSPFPYILKDFFQDDSLGVKAHTLSSSIKQLKVFTKLYSQTTDALISEFIKDFAAKGTYEWADVYRLIIKPRPLYSSLR